MSLEEETPQGKAAKEIHGQGIRYILSMRNWSCATEVVPLLSDALWSSANSARFPYRYRVPNKMVKLLRVFDSDEDQYYNWRLRGRFIYTDLKAISIEYIRDVVAEGLLDPALSQVLICYLAYLLAPRLTKEEETAARMYQEYQQALREAAVTDSQQKGPLFYGPNVPLQGDYYADHPNGWVDR